MTSSSSYAEVILCEDKMGKIIFTDNKSLCIGLKTKTIKTDESCGKQPEYEHKINYCTPRRQYQRAGNDWTIYLEKSMADGDKALSDKAIKKIEKNLNEILFLLPKKAAEELSKIDIYLMWGEKSPHGGRSSSMAYIRPGEPSNFFYLDPRWQNVIVVYSATNLMYLDGLWTKKVLMHELAHAWHLNNWAEKHPQIYEAYLNAKNKGLYLNVKDYKGKTIQSAYALKNKLEYFAELSAMYFVGGDYFPYDREGLSNYDLIGMKMISDFW
jgi:hypothetical protein